MTETRPHDVAAIKGVLESHYKAWDAGDAAGASAGIRCSRAPRSSRLSVWRLRSVSAGSGGERR